MAPPIEYKKGVLDTRFPVLFHIPPPTTSRLLPGENIAATVRISAKTCLHLILCQVPSDNIYGNILFLTKASSEKPLAAVVQRLTSCGSENFQEDFVSKLGRGLNAYTGTVVHADQSIYTINTESENGLLAMLPPYLDALFRPLITEEAYCKHVHTPSSVAETPGSSRRKGNMYRDLLEISRQKNRPVNIDELIYPKGTPYVFNIQGTADALTKIDIDESRAFHQHYYRPSNCFIVLAGTMDEYRILNVVKDFEDGLPESTVLASCKNPAKLACPPSPVTLLRPDVFHLFPDEAKNALTEQERRESLSMAPGLRVRFVSEIVEQSVKRNNKQNPMPKEVNLHLACQGPDVFDHAAFSAFLMLAHHFKHMLEEGPWEAVSLDIKERKWPLVVFTFHQLVPTEVEHATDEFNRLVESCLTQDERNMRLFIDNMVEQALMETSQQLQWRADYDTVKSVVWWLSGCSLDAPGAQESLAASIHPSRDFNEMKRHSSKWWKTLISNAYIEPVMVVEPYKGGPVTLDTLLRPLGTSSRYSMSSLNSERAFPLPEDLEEDDLRSLKFTCAPITNRPKETDWFKDEDVLMYCQGIRYDRQELFGGAPMVKSQLSPNSVSSEHLKRVRV
eukprot:Blabericola_migrator_1__6927@NODE_350_length_9522_cov_308_885246_g281_i0_p2_GENE_NODE_350_length_9522_cov_308_885246_g281_i0NODE_350_length_9522_cov_308_885246_g281_i0_p2_ORF_typecomplete_len619_score64_45Peptidase_M16_C/PF05193_21/1_8e07Peptidase_M16/PF00675_20/0_00047Peptidase_M16/PF00675_20/1_8e04TagF_N/PF09867_9/30TagF_N/PF09867_9/1_2_NODE_350_length_9522_cov_308_885246_g281_i02082064